MTHSREVGHLSLDEADQLKNGAECHIHYHPKQFPDLDDLVNLQAVNPGEVISSNTSLSNIQSLLLIDTSSSDITLNLPSALNGREYQVIKTSPLNIVYVVPVSGETVLGSLSGIAVTLFGTCIHLKAVTDNDWMII